MKKKINFNHILLSIVYILFELFIYYLFISNAFFNKYNQNINNIKLFGIIGVFAFSLLFFIFYLFKYKNQDKKDEIRDELLVLNGLFFTLISSIFIIIFETQYILIASTSIISELSYFLRLLKNDEIPKKRLKYSIFIRILLIVLTSLILSIILKDFDIRMLFDTTTIVGMVFELLIYTLIAALITVIILLVYGRFVNKKLKNKQKKIIHGLMMISTSMNMMNTTTRKNNEKNPHA